MIVLCGAGLGLLLMGGANLFLAARPRFVRLPILITCACAATLLPIFLAPGYVAVAAVGGVSLAYFGLLALGSTRLASSLQAISRFVRRPAGQGIALGSIGLITIAASYTYFSIAEVANTDREMALLAEMTRTPSLHASVVATTDGGRPISLLTADESRSAAELSSDERKLLENLGYAERLIRTGPASDASNSHGWVFAGGRYWVSPDDVEQILHDNGYQPVMYPHPEDLVIYRQKDAVVHSAVVRIAGEGSPLFVEGKWGWMGVFLHRVDESCYGKQYTFYRERVMPSEGSMDLTRITPERTTLLASDTGHSLVLG
jgi:hypothetical protein